jgi:lactoylglutathione lyase
MSTYWLEHIHLLSPDPLKTAEYYEKMFEAKKIVKNLGNGRTAVSVDLHGITILIAPKQGGEAEKPSLDHFGIATNNLNTAVAELKSKGVEFTKEITPVRPDFKISFLRTPDGVSIELQEGSL